LIFHVTWGKKAMSSTYTYPGVYIQELPSPVHPITGVATSVAAFVGYTATGIDNRAEMIFSFADYQRLFGGLASNSELSYAVQQFFQNGGSQAWVVRTPGSYNSASDQVYADVVFGSMTFSALSSGAWANGELLIDIDVQGLNLSSTTSPPGDPLSFNLTVTNLAANTTEYFPLLTLNANAQNFIANVLNDPDNGSQLVNANTSSLSSTPAALEMTGVVGTALSITGAGGVNQLLGGSTTATTANADCSLVLNLPPSFVPLPTIKVIGKGAPIPQSVQGLASQLQTAINNAMVVQMPGASVSCTAAPIWSGGANTGTGIRVNVLLPNMPDVVINFTSPPALTPPVNDAAGALGLLAGGMLGATVTMANILTALGGSATATTVTQNCTLEVNLPAVPAPVQVVVYEKGAAIPSSATPGGLAGIAEDLETAINDTLALVVVSPPIVFGGTTGVNKALGGTPTATTADADCDLTANLPASFTPSTVQVTVIPNTNALPTTASGVASALQSTLNTGLTASGVTVTCQAGTNGSVVISAAAIATGLPVPIKFTPPTSAGVNDAAAAFGLEGVAPPSAQVTCSVVSTSSGQAIEVTAGTADQADTAVSFTVFDPAPDLDAATPLGLVGGSVTTLAGPASVNVAHYALGTDNASMAETASTPAVPMDGLPGADQLTGDPLAFSGIYALSKVAFNLLCIPDAVRASAGNPTVLDTNNTALDPVAVYSAAIALCVQNRAMLLIDPPPTITTVAAAVDWKSSTIGVVNQNGAAFWPRLRLADPLNNSQLRTFAPSGVVAGVYANTDTTRGVWKAPAGIGAVLNGVQNMTYQMSDAENGVLNPLGLNCFRTFPVYGPVLWGARTLVGADAEASQWKYVPVRRVALFIESSLYQGTQWVVFEPNDEPLWSAIRLNVGSFMQNLFIEGFFQGQTPSQAYFVKCDSETTTQTDIDNGVVNIVVGFAPLYPAEFVVIQIQQITGQTTS
jgi:uncharacterized protein